MEKKILEKQWLKKRQDSISILDEASLTLVREKIREVANSSGLSSLVERANLIATELGRNQLHHARLGEMAIQKVIQNGVPGIEIIAADLGTGIVNPSATLRAEFSTNGSLGAGLSSAYQLSDQLDFDIRRGIGTCIWSRIFEKNADFNRHQLNCELAIIGQSYPGEKISGDNACFLRQENQILLSVADGLGHGILANEASFKGIQSIEKHSQQSLATIIVECNENLIGTRGSTLGLVRFESKNSELEHLGVGDINTHLYSYERDKKYVTMPHFLGKPFSSKHFRDEKSSVEPGMVLIMYSDGLKSETSLKNELDVLRQPAVSIAQWLLEKFSRSNDDATVLVAKFK